MTIFYWFYLHIVVSECSKSILACMANIRLKHLNVLGRKRQEDFAEYGEVADRHKTEPVSANF
jgi:hypothetical protein